MKKMLIILIVCGISLSVNATVVVTDHPASGGTSFDVLSVPNIATANGPVSPSVFGFDEGETYGQSFTLDNGIALDSIYVGYCGYNHSSTVTLYIDVDNDASGVLVDCDYTFAGNDFEGLVHGAGSDPISYFQLDLSSEGINLGAGQHAWWIEMTAEAAGSSTWAWAPARNYNEIDDSYPGGKLLVMEPDDDALFAVTEVPEPATLALMTLGGLGLIRRKRN